MPKTIYEIIYGIHDCELGRVVIGQTNKGLCWLGFMVSIEDGAYKGDGFTRMKGYFPDAEFIEDKLKTKQTLDQVLNAWREDNLMSVSLDLKGTEFQISVWLALLNIPKGKTVNYGQVANDIGRPNASRAVGTAVGDNPVSIAIPCHRIIQKSGNIGNYGWGVDLKRRLLDLESL